MTRAATQANADGSARRSPYAPARRRRCLLAAGGVLCLAAAALLFASDPSKPGGPYPFCIFHALTGLWCPGCGTLRALHQLLHGHVLAALGYNPLTVIASPFVAYAVASHALRWAGMRALPAPRMRGWYGWAALGIIVAFGVLRNIPAWPFRLLAP